MLPNHRVVHVEFFIYLFLIDLLYFIWIPRITPICFFCRKSTNNLLILWICFGSNTILNLLIISHFARKINKHITKSIRQTISTGMSKYLNDIIWKETIDKLQYVGQCCGVKSYVDWHETEWLTKYHVDVRSETIKQ